MMCFFISWMDDLNLVLNYRYTMNFPCGPGEATRTGVTPDNHVSSSILTGSRLILSRIKSFLIFFDVRGE